MDVLVTVMLVIVVALVFDFTNGFHDTANAMATSVATGALRPKVAVLISAVLNLVGAFLSTEVASTVSNGLIREGEGGVQVTPVMIFAGLVGAVLWNLATWYLGLPSSSSHALFGGLIGAAVIGAGIGSVDFAVVLSKVVLPAIISPVVAGVVALVATYAAYRITRQATLRGSTAAFRHGQTVSASLVSLAHGTNDAQKTMGVITLTLIAAGYQGAGTGPQLWVIVACGLAIALGTYLGGWRIMRTVGKRITDVKAPQGFAAETSSAATILISSHLGFALSTTQVTSGSIVGAGLGAKLATVHWGVVGKIASAWVFTLPAAALVGGVSAWLASTSTAGLVVVALLALGGGLAFAFLARRHPVTHETVNDGDEAPAAAQPAGASRQQGE
ncbi:PiT family inorganic phosphate transporter [Frigoribacterium sp. PvP120]|jgi:PiT family inorganic phosphate transporter|uniref:inorganic phosphate transporter n=1 Tax=unclassified Frigoribacterium TaxID=2627005 RepID=UPI001AE58E86|nr:inorganic phosphate transporter [Frigoribacterium sp. PvP121]MBP1242285.1 PiT family inorganic phosphate transporter [Frigoribacterium sp. PvP121]